MRNQVGLSLASLGPLDEDSRARTAAAIQELIIEDRLQAGDRLRSERQIAEHLGVGRAAVRDAIALLQQRGLIQIRPRSGTFLARVPPTIISDSIEHYMVFGNCSVEDLFVLRMALEPEAAALAAKRATSEDLATLGSLVAGIEDAFEAGEIDRYVENDVGFHSALATASKNELFVAILGGLLKIAIRNAVEQMSRPPEARGVYSHRPIYEAITARDDFWARVSTQAHMALTRRWFLRT